MEQQLQQRGFANRKILGGEDHCICFRKGSAESTVRLHHAECHKSLPLDHNLKRKKDHVTKRAITRSFD